MQSNNAKTNQYQIGSGAPVAPNAEPFLLSFALGYKEKMLQFDSDFECTEYKPSALHTTAKFESKKSFFKAKVWEIMPFGYGQDAHLPARIFSFKIKNTSKKKRKITFGVCVKNPQPEPLHSVVNFGDTGAVLLDSAKTVSVQPDYNTYCICMPLADEVLRYADEERFVFDRAETQRNGCAALLRHLELESGESDVVLVIIGWHRPNLCFSQNDASDICFENGFASRFDTAQDVVQYVQENLSQLSSAAKEMSKILNEYAQNDFLVEKFFENLRGILSQKPMKLVEFAKGKSFYKNRLKAPVMYATRQKDGICMDAFFADAEVEAEMLAFLVLDALDTDAGVLTLPQIDGGMLRWKAESLDTATLCRIILKLYRLQSKNLTYTFSQTFWEKLQKACLICLHPQTVNEKLLAFYAGMAMQQMCDFSLERESVAKPKLLQPGFSVVPALWMLYTAGFGAYDAEMIGEFLETTYLQMDVANCTSEEICAFIGLLIAYGRKHLAVSVCKMIACVPDNFLLYDALNVKSDS